jgi:hypothetical protein
MKMTIDNAIDAIEMVQTQLEVLQQPRSIAFDIAIDTMRKYQTMQEVLEKVWNVPSCMLDEAECLNQIMETYRTVRW